MTKREKLRAATIDALCQGTTGDSLIGLAHEIMSVPLDDRTVSRLRRWAADDRGAPLTGAEAETILRAMGVFE